MIALSHLDNMQKKIQTFNADRNKIILEEYRVLGYSFFDHFKIFAVATKNVCAEY